ncbi:hypothetical protein GOP47_0024072, partial [Adiantum capillus-veneris]
MAIPSAPLFSYDAPHNAPQLTPSLAGPSVAQCPSPHGVVTLEVNRFEKNLHCHAVFFLLMQVASWPLSLPEDGAPFMPTRIHLSQLTALQPPQPSVLKTPAPLMATGYSHAKLSTTFMPAPCSPWRLLSPFSSGGPCSS